MTALRVHLLLGTALIAAAGCAQQPKRADYTAPAPVEATAPSPAAAAASTQALMSAFPPGLLVFAYDQGWRQVVAVGSNHYFCRTDAPPGKCRPSNSWCSSNRISSGNRFRIFR